MMGNKRKGKLLDIDIESGTTTGVAVNLLT